MKKEDKAISQIIGATLLLLIALAVLSTVYMYVLTYPLPNPAPYVDIVGSIEDGNIVLTHRGGEALDFDTEVRLIMGENPKNITVGDYLDSESKEDEKWGIGEQLVYSPIEDITYLQVEAIVIDRVTESILFLGLIQDGLSSPPVSDALEFNPVRGSEPDIIHISGTTYAIAYRGDGDDGFLVTVEIADNGDITDTVTDTLEFDTDKGHEPDIIHISGNIYAIAYRSDNNFDFLLTVEIANNGTITDTVTDTLDFVADKGYEPDIIHVSGNIYAIAYRGNNDDGFLDTVEVANNGTITDTIIDTFEFDTDKGRKPDIIHVFGNTYAIAYEGENDDGWLRTLQIAGNGDIE
ncbi:MAG: type IV pilin [Thermoplasmatales archaeon]|nr:type IV pilin [Thermoplasmatales archaeon]